MATTFTLDMIRDAAEKKYGSFEVEIAEGEIVQLLNPMRMSKAKRVELHKLQARMDALGKADEADLEGVDEEAVIEEMLTCVCESAPKAKKLLKALGDDLAMKIALFNEYGSHTSAGEASASQD